VAHTKSAFTPSWSDQIEPVLRFFVMAGLDPAIQHLRKMDARVEPAHDD
jgi:hypothetical protein